MKNLTNPVIFIPMHQSQYKHKSQNISLDINDQMGSVPRHQESFRNVHQSWKWKQKFRLTKRLFSNDALLLCTKHGILSVQYYSLNSTVIVLFLVFMHSTSLALRCFCSTESYQFLINKANYFQVQAINFFINGQCIFGILHKQIMMW